MYFTLINPYFYGGDDVPKDSTVVNVTQLTTLSRTTIMNHLVSTGKLAASLVESTLLTTNPRNLYIDILLAKDYDIYYDEDQIPSEEPARVKRLIKLPINL